MAGRKRGATASHQSPGAAALRDAKERNHPAVTLLVDALGETSFNGHARGAVAPGNVALDLYDRLLGLKPGAFLNGEMRKRHERLAAKLVSSRGGA